MSRVYLESDICDLYFTYIKVNHLLYMLSVQQIQEYVARTVHRLKGKVTTSKTRPSRRDSSLINQRADQEDQDKPKEQDITKEKPPLSGRQAWRGRVHPEEKSQDLPSKGCRDASGPLPRQGSTAPPHSNSSHPSVRCRALK